MSITRRNFFVAGLTTGTAILSGALFGCKDATKVGGSSSESISDNKNIKKMDLGTLANSYLVEENGNYMLIDTGCYYDEPGFKYACFKNNIKPDDIDLIVVTHGHFDHGGYAGFVKQLTNAKIIAHKNAVEYLSTGNFNYYQPRNDKGKIFIDDFVAKLPTNNVVPTNVDIVVENELDLSKYGFNAKIYYMPGHSGSDLVTVLDGNIGFVGDLFLAASEEGNGVYALISNNVEELKETATKIDNLHLKSIYSGHGGPFTQKDLDNAKNNL